MEDNATINALISGSVFFLTTTPLQRGGTIKMNCLDYLEKIELVAILSKSEKQRLLKHLKKCTSCRHYYNFALRMEPSLQEGMCNITIPPLLREVVLSKLPKSPCKCKKEKNHDDFLTYPFVG